MSNLPLTATAHNVLPIREERDGIDIIPSIDFDRFLFRSLNDAAGGSVFIQLLGPRQYCTFCCLAFLASDSC